MRSRYFAALALSLSLSQFAHAGVVIGGTRFVYGEHQNALSVPVRNQGEESWLVNTKILNGSDWAGNSAAKSGQRVPFIATPPLFSLKGGHENMIRVVKTGGELPADRESLFTLSVSAIPSGRPSADSVQVAVRSRLKLLWRPADLKGDPQNAYRQLKWTATGSGLKVSNPTPYFVTLFNLSVGDKKIDNPGVVAPFSDRQTAWCQSSACGLRWQSINDYGRIMPVITQTASPQTTTATH